MFSRYWPLKCAPLRLAGRTLPKAANRADDPRRQSDANRNLGETRMPLDFSGDSHTTMNVTIYRTTGSNGETIVVDASYEAIQDFGEARVQAKANDKYDAGLVYDSKVTVSTADFPQNRL
jgi:hypothetical protein